jgi:hypothetical protein
MKLIIQRDGLGYFEARILGNARDDIAAGSAPSLAMAIDALRFAVSGLPNGNRRNAALALLNN